MKNIWYNMDAKSVLAAAKSSPQGLSSIEGGKRLEKSGPNELPSPKPYSALRLFFSQFNNPLMYILFSTVVISLVLKHYTDTVFIVLVLLANTLVGFYQENQANNSITDLKKLVKIKARVLRDGREQEIESWDLVVGDIVILSDGGKVPADARILECRNFKTNEASLTGESQSASKQAKKLPANKLLAERTNMVFMGTLVDEGWAKAVVTGTGLSTEVGEIVSLLEETEETKTPLQAQMDRLAKFLGAFVVLVILLILALGLLRLNTAEDILLASLSLAVAAIPAGLLPAITLILVLGMRRILKKNGLVRKLVATETLGSVTVICTDKTGTLTEGRMAVTHFVTATKEISAKQLKNFNLETPGAENESIKQLARIAVLNNDGYIENPQAAPDKWIIRGKITEQALLRAGSRMGFDKTVLEQEFLLVDKIFFSSELKYSATLRDLNNGSFGLFVLGAPEVILKHTAAGESKTLEKRMEALTRQGLRVLAGAYMEFKDRPKYKKPYDLMKDLTLVGLVALEDPIRSEVVESILLTKRAGIRTIIVTGDHRLTAVAVAKNIGLDANESSVLDGSDIETLSDSALAERIKTVSVFARVSPKHKLRIVAALQSRGEIVAMVGDGVNDAPALKLADIGVAVNSGTDVAREVADLILLDNGFHSIVKSIEQGRISFANIRKVFTYLVVDDFSQLFLFLCAMLIGLPLPLLPAQILWINLVQDGLPDLALSTEQETSYVMDRPPRKHGEQILNLPLKRWLFAVSLAAGVAALVLFYVSLQLGMELHKAQTMVFALMGLDSLLFVFSVRYFHLSILRWDIFSNKLLTGATIISLGLMIMSIYAPFMHRLLNTRALTLSEWLVISGICILEMVAIETTKKIFISRKI